MKTTPPAPTIFGNNGSGHKPRIQGKIAQLSIAQRARLHQLFRENLIYTEIRARLKAEFGLSISSTSLSNYYKLHAPAFMLSRANASEVVGDVNEAHFTLVLHFEIRPEIINAEQAGA
jgi:hypothetical protein